VFDPAAEDRRAELVAMIEAWLEHARRHPDATRLVFVPVSGDPEVEQAQRELHARQRATQTALLREFAPDLKEPDGEVMGEVARSSLAGVALWWLEHPEVPREVPLRVLLRMVDGLIGSVDETKERT
jgi:hypothetical protein